MAAGLPILCNELDFVKSVVLGHDIGAAVNFNDEPALVAAINAMAADKSRLRDMSLRSRKAFVSSFNWQVTSAEVCKRIDALVDDSVPGPDLDYRRLTAPAGVSEGPIWEADRAVLIADKKAATDAMQAEINRLNEVYTAEIVRLRQAVAPVGLLRRFARPLRPLVRMLRAMR